MKILHRAATTGVGGLEKYVLINYKYIDREKFQFEFITRNKNLPYLQEIKDLNIPVNIFEATEHQNKELLIHEIKEILDQGYDVLHMNTSMWAGFLIEELAIERRIPKIIVHSHSTGIDFEDKKKRKYYQELHEYYKVRFNKNHATHFCACSKEAAEWLFGPQIPREEIRILKNAIEVEKFLYNETIRKKVRRELGLDDCFIIGHIGRFSYQKNHRFLIDVFKDVYKKNPKARLLLIGKGELEDEIHKQVKEYGLQDAVMFLGWRDDVNELMQAMDLFVLPSRFEGLPVVLIETQTSGLPSLISESITKEVSITDKVKFLSLMQENWVREIILVMDKNDRDNMEKQITDAGYNIRYAVKELEQLYEL